MPLSNSFLRHQNEIFFFVGVVLFECVCVCNFLVSAQNCTLFCSEELFECVCVWFVMLHFSAIFFVLLRYFFSKLSLWLLFVRKTWWKGRTFCVDPPTPSSSSLFWGSTVAPYEREWVLLLDFCVCAGNDDDLSLFLSSRAIFWKKTFALTVGEVMVCVDEKELQKKYRKIE